MGKRLEEELYKPVKDLFETMGFAVKAEVLNCDVIAVRGEDFVAIELKTKLNLDVILQAVDRQRVADLTYLAVFAMGLPKNRKKLKAIEHLLKRLEIGFIIVDEDGDDLVATLIFDGLPFDLAKSKRANQKKSLALKKEFESRLGDDNIGGTTRRKRMTAYRQDAIGLAILLQSGVKSTKSIREESPYFAQKIRILQIDHYGWFKRVQKGQYQLTDAGIEYLEQLDPQKKESYLNRVKKELESQE